ncbi:haloacid dehalogenase-like hydrolase [Aerococcus viridans]
MKRFLSANTSDMSKWQAADLKQSIRASEGRVIVSENVATRESFIGDITNAEIARAFGADLILLNGVDVLEPYIFGLEEPYEGSFVDHLHKLVGRPIGVNLEPVDNTATMAESKLDISRGRQANEDTFKKIEELNFDFVCFTGNPGTGVSNKEILAAVKDAKKHFSGLIIAGKMHGAGVAEPVASVDIIKDLVEAGADVILVPAVGTVPGFDEAELKASVAYAHEKGALVMSAIGTSQESADEATIRELAIKNKICGVDMQHIGDAGYGGVAVVENIIAMGLAIRGRRHQYSMMARSINR